MVVADRESAPSGRALAALVQALARLGYVAVLRFVAKDHSVLRKGLQTRTLAVMSSAFLGGNEAWRGEIEPLTMTCAPLSCSPTEPYTPS